MTAQLAFLAGLGLREARLDSGGAGHRLAGVRRRRAAAPACSWPVTASRKSGRAIASSTDGSLAVAVAVRGHVPQERDLAEAVAAVRLASWSTRPCWVIRSAPDSST